MTEIEQENKKQLNQICKDFLIMAGEVPDAGLLYVLQLMRWAMLQKKHGLPWACEISETDVLSMVEKLMGINPARVMEFLTQEPYAGDSYEVCVEAEDLYGETAEVAAKVLIKALHSRIPVGRVGINTHWRANYSPVPNNSIPLRHLQRWLPDEDRRLLAGYGQGVSVDILAQQHERSRISIRARLIRLGRVDPYRKGDGYFGSYRPDLKGYERDRLAWTDHEQFLLAGSYNEDSLTNINRLAEIHRRHPLTIAFWLASLKLRYEPNVTVNETDLHDDIRPFEVIDDFERTEHKYLKQIGERFGFHAGLLSFKEVEEKVEEAEINDHILDADERESEAEYFSAVPFDGDPPLRSESDWSEVGDDLDSRDFEDYMGGPDDPDSYPEPLPDINDPEDNDPPNKNDAGK